MNVKFEFSKKFLMNLMSKLNFKINTNIRYQYVQFERKQLKVIILIGFSRGCHFEDATPNEIKFLIFSNQF